MALEFEMLQIMVVAGQIYVRLILPEQRIPVADQNWMVSMRPVRVDRVMPHDNQEGSCPRTLQLRFEPCQLFGLLSERQREILPVLGGAVLIRHVAVERDKRDQRILGRELKAVPARRHCPACMPAFGIRQFCVDFAVGPLLIVMVAEDGIGAAGKGVSWIHLFKLCLPPRRLRSVGQLPVSTGTLAAANYSFLYVSGALTIGKTAATITVTPYAVTYNGSPLTATGTATGIGRVSLPGLTLNTTHTAVGTYNDTWTFTDSTGNYNNASGTITDTILPASLVITASSASMIYGGAAGHAQLYGIRKQPERVRPDD